MLPVFVAAAVAAFSVVDYKQFPSQHPWAADLDLRFDLHHHRAAADAGKKLGVDNRTDADDGNRTRL